MKNYLSKIPRYIWLLGAITMIGMFLRTWHLHELARFDNDQARDTAIVSSAITGQSPLPLLGPQAGGTPFRLGPIFYYFEYASAKIFGNSPIHMAYPDVFFSIITAPLLFFFMRIYFSRTISLLLSFLFAISSFSVLYGRFAWNPNSMPFWSLLLIFSLCKLFSSKTKKKYLWASIAGISLGVAVQLHTLLLVILPIYLVILFGWAIFKSIPVKKYFALIFLLAFLLNIPQVVYELSGNRSNISAFFEASKIKRSPGDKSLVKSIANASSCTLQSNLLNVSGWGNPIACDFFSADGKGALGELESILRIIFGLALTIEGITFLWKKNLQEKNEDRLNFLFFVAVYGILYFLIIIPVAESILNKAMRYYLGMMFVSFVFLGLWLDFIKTYFKENKKILVFSGLIVLVFTISNITALTNDLTLSKIDKDLFTLGEGEAIAKYIQENSLPNQKVYIEGNKSQLFHIFKPIRFLAPKVDLQQYDSQNIAGAAVFYVGIKGDQVTGTKHYFGRYIVAKETP